MVTMSVSSTIYLAVLLAGITLFVIYARIGRLFKCVFFTLVTGFISLGAVMLAANFTSLRMAFTPLSALVSGLFGVPGVLGMLILNLL